MTGFTALTIVLSVPFGEYYTQSWESLFMWYDPAESVQMSAEDFIDHELPEERVALYLEEWNSFESGIDFDQFEYWEQSMSAQKKAGLERGMTALSNHPEAQAEALAFIDEAPIFYEWEGDPEAIGMESAYALEYLSESPDSPIAPSVLLMALHRIKAQRECLDAWGDGSPDSLVDLYDSLLEEALDHPDPLVGAFAAEMDGAGSIYVLME